MGIKAEIHINNIFNKGQFIHHREAITISAVNLAEALKCRCIPGSNDQN